MSTSSADLVATLHKEHAHALWAFALRLCAGDHGRAEDVVQETLLRAWRHRGTLDGSAATTRAWLFTVARHVVVDEWRRGRTRREVLAADVPEPADRSGRSEADGVLESWLVADALTRLSPEHRAVLVLCYFGGRSVAEAAEELRVPPGTVKSRTHYALRQLRLALQEMGVTR